MNPDQTQLALLIIGLVAVIGLSVLRVRIERKGRKTIHHMFIQEEGKLK